MMKKKLLFLFSVLCLLTTGCGGDDPLNVEPDDPPKQPEEKPLITLSDTVISLKIGEEKPLTYQIKPDYQGDVIWSSTNNQIISVSDKGTVKGISVGEATVSLKLKQFPEITAICKINVSAILLESISLSEKEITRTIGDSIQLSVDYLPQNATNKRVTWKSSNSDIASVNNEGVINFNKVGNCIISVTSEDGNYIATCQINVLPVEIKEISFNPNLFEIATGETYSLIEHLKIVPVNADMENLIWESNNTNICSIDKKGNIYGENIGETTISVYSTDRKLHASCVVNVVRDDVILNKISAWIEGVEKDLYGNIRYPNGICKIINNNINEIKIFKVTTYGVFNGIWKKYQEGVRDITISGGENGSCSVSFHESMKPYAYALIEFTHGDKSFSIKVYVP